VPLAAPVAAPTAFLATVPAAATTAWLLRERFTAWLTALRWPDLAIEDVVFALSEAVSNCTEHAYPPDAPDPVIEISATIEPGHITERAPGGRTRPDTAAQSPGQRLRIRIRDHGTWRPIPPGPSYRGRGLQMMTALMDDVVIHHSGTDHPGTEVILVSPTVAPTPP
jgi:anti-sigma regulatory factor (Ser/Thr protein kinase)